MKKIKSRSELPDWFQLRNYEESIHFNTLEWHANLTTRKEASKKFSNLGLRTQYYGYNQLLETQPLIRAVDSPEESREYEDSNENLVFTLDKHQAYSFFLELHEEEQVRVKNMFINLTDDNSNEERLDEIEGELYAPLIKELILYDEKWKESPSKYSYYEKNYNTLYAGVNLEASNDLIIEHFKLWLEDAREKLQFNDRKIQFKKHNFLNWYEDSVLPYLDLTIWAEKKGVEIPHKIMGEAIYPPEKEVDLSQAVRRTTKPLAEELMRYGWAMLNKQAYLEQYPIKTS